MHIAKLIVLPAELNSKSLSEYSNDLRALEHWNI